MKAPFRQRFEIARETGFVIGAAFEIFEHEARQAAMRHRPQILDRRGAARIAARIEAPGRGAGENRRRGPRQDPCRPARDPARPGRRDAGTAAPRRQGPTRRLPSAAAASATGARRRATYRTAAPVCSWAAATSAPRALALRFVKHRVHRLVPSWTRPALAAGCLLSQVNRMRALGCVARSAERGRSRGRTPRSTVLCLCHTVGARSNRRDHRRHGRCTYRFAAVSGCLRPAADRALGPQCLRRRHRCGHAGGAAAAAGARAGGL